ncbi:hypothetical protein FB451DRAFT_1459799 [Mycena latifolia]|nr:hypothetical protein FB451DRAFT_1459799 [Mycena latifolia]
MKQMAGGDLIHAWDLVSGYQISPELYRDATFIKLERQTFFGQVRKFIALSVPADFPARRDAGAEEQVESARPRTIILAAVAQAKLTRQNSLQMPYFDAKSSDLGPPSEVIDVSTINCLAGRIRDAKRWACLIRPEVAAKFQLVQNSTIGDSDDS